LIFIFVRQRRVGPGRKFVTVENHAAPRLHQDADDNHANQIHEPTSFHLLKITNTNFVNLFGEMAESCDLPFQPDSS
jgi:hypothetical protein